MADILTILPEFDTSPFAHILPSLEKALLSIADLLTLDAVDAARRAQVPQGEVKKLGDALLHHLRGLPGTGLDHRDSDSRPNNLPSGVLRSGKVPARTHSFISTLDDHLDAALGGGIATGHLTEFTGESAAGKTQFLLTLLLSVQLLQVDSRARSALYVSTESQLQTARLTQILNHHPKLSSLPSEQKPTLSRIQSTHTHDLEAQEHILRYQVPVAVERGNVGLVVIDSIAANYRAELDKGLSKKGSEALAKRGTQLAQLGAHLRALAQRFDVAIVVANQVADRFSRDDQLMAGQMSSTQLTQRSRPTSPVVNASTSAIRSSDIQQSQLARTTLVSTDDPLALDHQQRFFTGWGDRLSATNLKTPSLSLAWTNQLATRIALIKESHRELQNSTFDSGAGTATGGNRTCKIVFSAWCAEDEIEYEIWEGGVRSVPRETEV